MRNSTKLRILGISVSAALLVCLTLDHAAMAGDSTTVNPSNTSVTYSQPLASSATYATNAGHATSADSSTNSQYAANAGQAAAANTATTASKCTGGAAGNCYVGQNSSPGGGGPIITYQWVKYATVQGSHGTSFKNNMIGMPQYSWDITELRQREYINGQETMNPAVWKSISSADSKAITQCSAVTAGGISSYPTCDNYNAGVTVSACHNVYNGQIGALVCNISYTSSTMELSGTDAASCFLYENNTTPEQPCSRWP